MLKRWWQKLLVGLVLSGLLLAGGAFWYYQTTINTPLNFGDKIYDIKRGDTFASVIKNLVDQEIIKEPYSLKIYARLNNLGTQIKAGEYRFPEGTNSIELLQRLVSGKGQIGIRITFIEGWTFRQMREQLAKAKKLKQLTMDWTEQQIMAELGAPELHPEGQFYPDTYHYRSGDSDLSIFKKAFDTMQQKLDLVWSERQENIQLKSRYEALIMASIIEKETQARQEQPHIAGVFDNRLRIGMRLQTDPTVIYGIGTDYDGNITRKHLKTDTPYNTYTRGGLPPTPISLPGFDSLHAAVNPLQTESLYFVAKGKGLHKFSKTLEEHNAAVRKYILKK